jgi:basic amino acid/polyamine antiporter, APA family
VLLLYPFLALTVAAVFVLRRRRPELERPYPTAGYPVVPLIFLVGTMAMLGNAALERPATTLISVAIAAAGLPVYAWWRRSAAGRATADRE